MTCRSRPVAPLTWSVRPPAPGDMRIVDDAGKELPHDGKTVGHLQVRVGACVCLRVGGRVPHRSV